MTQNIPLITAVMLTQARKNRQRLIEMSIGSFKRQTYSNKMLLIINSGEPLNLAEHNIQEVSIQSQLNVGETRNHALNLISDGFVMNWDDDDWSHPDRMNTQVDAYKPGYIVLLKSQIRLDTSSREVISVSWNFGIFGTMLWQLDDKRFPHLQKDEDVLFVESFPGKRIVVNNDPLLHVRTFGGDNLTCHKRMMECKGRSAVNQEQQEYLNETVWPQIL